MRQPADLTELLAARAAHTPEALWTVFGAERLTYGDLQRESDRVAAFLAERGTPPGAAVLLLLDNSPGFLASFLGALVHGAVPVPVSPKSPPERVAFILRDCGAELALVDDHFPSAPLAEFLETQGLGDARGGSVALVPLGTVQALAPAEIAPAPARRVAFIQYTSGSTGQPKGAVISHAAVLANLSGFTRAMGVERGRDVFSSMMPLFHDMGLVCFGLGPLFCGVPLVLYRQEALSLTHWLEGIGEHKVTVTGGPNIFLHLANRVVRDPASVDLSSLRLFICGSEPIHPPVVRAFEERFRVPGIVKPAYGMAEITLCASFTAANDTYRLHDERTISCGRPLDEVEIAIDPGDGSITRAPLTAGEILIRTPALMDGYFGRPELTPEVLHQGYYRSGDRGFLDAEGRVYVTGRIKNLAIKGGEKFALTDFEVLASEQPEPLQAAAVALRHPGAAEDEIVLVLEVARARAREAELAQAARSLCREAERRLRCQPDRIVFVGRGRIPVTPNGKIQHQALRESLAAQALPFDLEFRPADLRATARP